MRKYLHSPIRLTYAGIAAILLMGLNPASAASYSWNTSGGGVWSTGGDWTGTGGTGTVPGSGDTAVFNLSTLNSAETIQLSQAQSLLGMIFNNTGTTTIDSSSTTPEALSLGTGGMTIASTAGAVTLGNATDPLTLSLAGVQTWTNNAAATANALSVIAPLSGANALTLAGVGTIIFSGSNTNTGGMTLSSSGTAQFQANAANTVGGVSNVAPLPVSSGTITTLAEMPSGSTIQLRGDSTIASGNVISFDGGATQFGINTSGSRISGTFNYDVNNLTTGTGQTLQFGSPTATWFLGTGVVGTSLTINTTGGNGDSLQIGNFSEGNNYSVTFNPTTANIIVGSIFNASTGSLTKNGAGMLTMAGGTSNYTGATNVAAGTLNLTGTINSGTTSTAVLTVGNTASTDAVMDIQSNAALTGYNLNLSTNATAVGAVYQNGGAVTLGEGANSTDMQVGAVASAYGYYNLSGGTLSTNEIDIGGGFAATTGVVDVAGGTLTDTGYVTIGRGTTTSSGLLNVTGGAVNYGTTAGAGPLDLNWAGSAGAISVVNIGGGSGGAAVTGKASSTTTGEFSGFGLNLDAVNTTAGSAGIVNLLTSGTLTVSDIEASAGATATSLVNFNGGTLKAASTNLGGTFLTNANITGVFVYGNGGTIDNNGTSITIGKSLLAPGGNGVSSVAVSNNGAGYVGAPLVTFTGGGGGVGATGYAVITGGTISKIVITNPGYGYTTAPTVVFTGGGATTTAVATAGTSANSSGGMTFQGAGATTYSGTATYTGATNINAGTFNLTGTLGAGAGGGTAITSAGTFNESALGGIVGSSSFTNTSGSATLAGVNSYTGATNINGGTLNLTGSYNGGGAMTIASGAALLGAGYTNGAMTVAGGATVTLLNATGGTLTLANGLTIGSAGNHSTLNLAEGGAAPNLLQLGSNTLTVNAGGAVINIYSLGIQANQSYNLIDFGAGTGSGFATGTGSTVDGFSLGTLPTVFGVSGYGLTVSSTAVQLTTAGTVITGNVYWSGTLGSQWNANNGTTGNFTSDAAGTQFLNALPGSSATVIFSGSNATNFTNTLGQSFSVQGVVFSGSNSVAVGADGNILTVGSGGVTVQSGAGPVTLGVNMTGPGGVTANSTALTLAGNDSYSGATAINSGTVSLTGTLSGATAITNATTFTEASTAAIAGGASFTNTSGTATLSGANSFTGGSTLNGGVVVINSASSLGGATSGVLLNGATVITTAGIANVNPYTVGANGGTLDITGSATNGTGHVQFGTANTLLGSGSLTIMGTGAITTYGMGNLWVSASNSYSGAITLINGGSFEYGVNNAVSSAATFTLNGVSELVVDTATTMPNSVSVTSSGGNFSFNNGNTGVVSGPIALSGNANFELRNWYNLGTSSGIVSGLISGTGGINTFTGSTTGGTLYLANSDTYTGATTINAGTVLELGTGGTLGSISPSSTLTNSGTLAINRSNATVEGTDFASNLGGTGGLTQAGTGSLTLGGSNSYTATTLLTSGTLILAANAGNTNGAGVSSALSNATPELLMSANTTLGLLSNSNNTIFEPAAASGTSVNSGVVETGAGPFNFFVGNNGSGTGNTVILANIGQFGAGSTTPTYNISGSNGYTLQLGSGASGTGALSFYNNTAINSTNAGITVSIPGGMTVDYLLGYTLTLGGAGNFSLGALVQDGTANALIVTDTATGTVSMSGSNAYTGATTVGASAIMQFVANSGNTASGTSSAMSSSSKLTLNNTATVQLLANQNTVFTTGTLNPGGGSTTTYEVGAASSGANNTLTLNSASGYTVGGNSVTMTFNITGSNGDSLVIAGAANFSGNNNNGFELVPTSASVTIAGNVVGTGNTGQLLTLDGTSTGNSIAGNITGSGVAVTKSNSSTWTLPGTNSYAGATTVSGGLLVVTGSLNGTGSASVGSGATLDTEGLVNTAATITLNGGTVQGQGTVGAINSVGGTVAPGLSSLNGNTGTLTASSLSLDSTSSFDIRVAVTDAVAGTDSDALAVTTGSSVSLGNATLNIFLGANIAEAQANTFYNIILGGYNSALPTYFGNTNEVNGIGTIAVNGLTFDVIYGSDGTNDGQALVGNDVSLKIAPASVPEPGTWAMLLVGAASLSGFRFARRRRS